VFQQEYASAFDSAERVIIAAVDHPERAPEGQRFSPEDLVRDLRARGRMADYVAGVGEIIARVADGVRDGDVVVIMSNGAFGGIHARLLEALRARSGAR
jgi:UDP-N-acetylmuramate: L-alanyl-gamma-D-glutamyl-meso-diaminopimelate ligase